MAIPDKVLEKAGELGAQATQNAANLTQSPDAQWHDVWTQTGSGMLSPPALSPFIPAPGEAMTPEVAARIKDARAAADDWGRADLEGVVNGLEQQANTIKEQAAQIWNAEDAKGQPLTTLQRVGAAFGLLTSVEQFYSVLWTSWIPFPAFPALRVMDIDVGLPHAHMHPPNLIPPNPVPVPLPSTGPVIPIPFLSGASKTLINAMPAARCGDMGLGVFCGGFFPMYEVFLGSSSVWIEGNRAGRLGVDITKHCIFSAPKPSDPPVGPMFGTTVMGSPNVMIGGVPLPSLTSMAIGAAFKAVFKAGGKLIGAARKRLGKARPPVRNNEITRRILLNDPPHMTVVPKKTPRAESLLFDLASGQRKVVKEISAGELLYLTRATGDEWGVVIQADGKLAVIRGTPMETPLQHGDIALVHTHPEIPGQVGPGAPHPSDGDLSGHAADVANHGWDHPEAVIGQNGEVRFFDGHGTIPDHGEQMLPIANDGTINGVHHMGGDPDVPISAIPPPMLQ